jgi:hypothetical protein
VAEQETEIFTDRVRKTWHLDDWWFSVTDVVAVLTDSPRPRKYWDDLKRDLAAEGFAEVSAKCLQLKMPAADGKMRTTDAATTETILRIVQSIPSPKAEPFKRWLAQVGSQRLQENARPSQGVERLMKVYQHKGYTDEWIGQRVQNIIYRNTVVAEWSDRGADQGRQIAALTDVLNKGAFGLTTAKHKELKGLRPKEDLRDSETILELAITGVAEATAATLHRQRDTQGYTGLKADCVEAGDTASEARQVVERRIGRPVVSAENYKQLQQERQRELQPPLFPEE